MHPRSERSVLTSSGCDLLNILHPYEPRSHTHTLISSMLWIAEFPIQHWAACRKRRGVERWRIAQTKPPACLRAQMNNKPKKGACLPKLVAMTARLLRETQGFIDFCLGDSWVCMCVTMHYLCRCLRSKCFLGRTGKVAGGWKGESGIFISKW